MITPLDIRKLEFSRRVRGLDPDEVRSALESVAKELEDQVKENGLLSEKLKVAEERLNHFRLMEKTLQDSVVTIQTTLDEKRKAAEQEADLIIREAKLKAHREAEDYAVQIRNLKSEIDGLRSQRAHYFVRFKNFLLGQLEWLNAMEKEEIRGDPLSTPDGEERLPASGGSRQSYQ